jgi:hypothetical protein
MFTFEWGITKAAVPLRIHAGGRRDIFRRLAVKAYLSALSR